MSEWVYIPSDDMLHAAMTVAPSIDGFMFTTSINGSGISQSVPIDKVIDLCVYLCDGSPDIKKYGELYFNNMYNRSTVFICIAADAGYYDLFIPRDKAKQLAKWMHDIVRDGE